MNSKIPISILLWFLVSCTRQPKPVMNPGIVQIASASNENPFKKIASIPLPEGYSRLAADSGSFSAWLRDINLKKDMVVHQFNGRWKLNQAAQFAVLDISVGEKDLQQCADAVMRLRAEFLFDKKAYSDISFTDNDEKTYQFSQPYIRSNFHHYLERVFGMCGTASLSKQLKPVDMNEVQPGDVLIRGGFPGHAVIVMDVAINKQQKKIFLLAQSYMPAQDIHILNNPSDKVLSPWYAVNESEDIPTPEYLFKRNELKRW